MKKSLILKAPASLLAAVLVALGGVLNAGAAAAPALTPQLILRPVTPGDVTRYALPSTTETSGGINTVGLGTPVYLEAEINSAIAASNITSVTWVLTNLPFGSAAVLTNNPLGTNVPVYDVSDRLIYQVAGRKLFRPDVHGQYTVIMTVNTSTSGSASITNVITAGTYLGVNTCALCHSGGVIAEDKFTTWQTTAHASIFTQGINGALGSYSVSCLKCHTAGYDTNTNAVNGGFDDVATQLGWVFPTVLTNTNWAYMQAHYPSLASLGNIQCENCHGPGSEHAYSLGNTNFITVTKASGDCNQCHDAPSHHIYGTEWYASGHAVTTRIPTGAGRDYCVGCHTATGFVNRLASGQPTTMPPTDTTYVPIDCQTCHEPHGETTPTNNPHLLRILGSVTMPDGTVVTNAGEGALCLECHHNRNGSATNQLVKYPLGQATWAGGSSFGPHDGPQGDMVEGVNAITYGLTIPSSAHRQTVTNLCVGCHMQTLSSSDPGLLLAGGHTFNMSYNVTNNNVVSTVDKVDTCNQCHGGITSFNFPVQDYNGDGVIEGVQTEVQHLLDKLSTLLPNSSGVVDGTVKTSLSVKTNWSQAQLKAAYNWQFVSSDGSLGVHNAPFATGILKASIGDLTGDANNDGLPDAWQIQYLGSVTNPLAAPNATPAGDGIPNWLKYALGLNPNVAGVSVPNGVVWVNNSTVNGNNATNTVQIYTAAEVAFNTQIGTTYQIQGISAMGGSWQNIGAPIPGTGSAISYLTPTRHNVQQYFRVVHTP